MLYRSDSADYRTHGPDVDNRADAETEIPPPTPAFPISPPTPYGKNKHFLCQWHNTSTQRLLVIDHVSFYYVLQWRLCQNSCSSDTHPACSHTEATDRTTVSLKYQWVLGHMEFLWVVLGLREESHLSLWTQKQHLKLDTGGPYRKTMSPYNYQYVFKTQKCHCVVE